MAPVYHSPGASPRPKVALVTEESLPQLTADDAGLIPALAAEGIEATAVVWTDETVEWSQFDGVLIRSPWDYTEESELFLRWVDHVDGVSTLWNPASLIHWNADKRYLQQLEQWGVPIVPTRWWSSASGNSLDAALAQCFQETGWSQVVIKPSVGAGGRRMFRLTPGELIPAELNKAIATYPCPWWMVQPWWETVSALGEVSLILIGDELVHTVRKFPASNEYRVQGQFGGTTVLSEPTELEQRLATQTLTLATQRVGRPLYSRVDCLFNTAGVPYVSELEWIEPALFQSFHPQLNTILAQAVARELHDKTTDTRRRVGAPSGAARVTDGRSV